MASQFPSSTLLLDFSGVYLSGEAKPVQIVLTNETWEAFTSYILDIIELGTRSPKRDLPLDKRIEILIGEFVQLQAIGSRIIPFEFDDELDGDVPF